MVEGCERNYRELTNRLQRLYDGAWERPGRFVEELSAYIRPMGGRMPSIYGPTGHAAPA
jgi:hypothetical protein